MWIVSNSVHCNNWKPQNPSIWAFLKNPGLYPKTQQKPPGLAKKNFFYQPWQCILMDILCGNCVQSPVESTPMNVGCIVDGADVECNDSFTTASSSTSDTSDVGRRRNLRSKIFTLRGSISASNSPSKSIWPCLSSDLVRTHEWEGILLELLCSSSIV